LLSLQVRIRHDTRKKEQDVVAIRQWPNVHMPGNDEDMNRYGCSGRMVRVGMDGVPV